jgi:hypothetical protein
MSQCSRSNSLSKGTIVTKNYHGRGTFYARSLLINACVPCQTLLRYTTRCGPVRNLRLGLCIEYLALAIKEPIHVGSQYLSSYFGSLGVRARYICEGAGKPEY